MVFAWTHGSNTATLCAPGRLTSGTRLTSWSRIFTDDIDLLFVPIMAWLRVNQPDIMTTDEGRKKGFAWFADINNDSSLDVSISLLLTERTLVNEVDGATVRLRTSRRAATAGAGDAPC
ncbi:phage tail protein [Klebsiella pneumoniae]|uniref:phage tail protein n=1 Tax=Klebsiella pneumoniae TaxID=573 RepID=UPI003985B32D